MDPINSISSPISAPAGQAIGAPAPAASTAQKAEEAAKGFESVLMGKMMEEMQKTVPKSGLFEDSTQDQVQSLFWMQLSQDLSQKGGMGLWKQLYAQFNTSETVAAASAAAGARQGQAILPAGLEMLK